MAAILSWPQCVNISVWNVPHCIKDELLFDCSTRAKYLYTQYTDMGICSYIRDPSRIGGELYRKKLWSLWRGSASQALWGLGHHSDGSAQDCNISSASALEILQSCTELSVFLKIYTAHMDGFVKKILNSMIDYARGHVWFEKAKFDQPIDHCNK